MSDIFFTSDLHFGHINIIKHCSRPFQNVDEMDQALIDNWNKKVKPGDLVYLLGDFSLAKDAQKIPNYVRALRGQVHLILGNHDEKRLQFLKGFADVKQYKRIKVGEQKIALLHYPMMTWHGSHRGTWHLHGHCHGSLPRDYKARRLDMGVDVWSFSPLSFEEVQEEMKKHHFEPVDHHRERDEL